MKKSAILIGLVVLTSAFFRLYHFSRLFHWSMDEEYWAYIARNIAIGEHLPLIGGNIGGTGFHTTPWLVYLLGIVSRVVGGNPIGLGLAMAGLGIVTTFLIYLLGREMVGRKAAVIAAFLYGFSASAAFADRRFWNPSVIPILTLLIVYSLWRIKFKNDLRSYLLLAISIGMFFASHGLAIIFLLFAVVIFIWQRKVIKKNYLVIAVLILTTSMVPLFLFEFRHNFIETRRFLGGGEISSVSLARLPQAVSLITSTSSRFFYYPGDLDIQLNQTYGCSQYGAVRPFSVLSAILMLVVMSYLLLQMVKGKFVFDLLGIASVILSISLIFWPEGMRGYYLYPFFIFLAITGGSFFAAIQINRPLKLISFLTLGVLFYLNLQKIIFSYHSDSYEKKLIAVNEAIVLSDNTPFSIDVQASDSCRSYGYRYLFSFQNIEPVKSYMDPYFLWLYENRLAKTPPQKSILLKLMSGNKDFVVTSPAVEEKTIE